MEEEEGRFKPCMNVFIKNMGVLVELYSWPLL